MTIARSRHILIILQLNPQHHILFLRLSQLLSKFMYLFKQFLQTLLIFTIIFLYFNLNFFVVAWSLGWCHVYCFQIDLLLVCGNVDWFEWLYLSFLDYCCLVFHGMHVWGALVWFWGLFASGGWLCLLLLDYYWLLDD